MAADDELDRQSIRLKDYDYAVGGAYFVTLCRAGRACVFGAVESGQLRPSRRGLVASEVWGSISAHRPNVMLDEFVVMPNHVHGILWITGPDAHATDASSPVGATRESPKRRPRGPDRNALGAIVGMYKAAVSREINRLRPGAADGLWQRNYYEHVIRTQEALERIREYIRLNPARWPHDRENPDGDGADDHELFLRSLYEVKAAAGSDEGDSRVAPTGRRGRSDGGLRGGVHRCVDECRGRSGGSARDGVRRCVDEGDASVAPTKCPERSRGPQRTR
jgi:REP element-mobilizing transposase RayT